jgi:hypothetical protein
MNGSVQSLRTISPKDFAALGMEGFAYIKQVVVNDAVAYAIHAADGTQIGLAPTRDIAVASLVQHELEPLSVH